MDLQTTPTTPPRRLGFGRQSSSIQTEKPRRSPRTSAYFRHIGSTRTATWLTESPSRTCRPSSIKTRRSNTRGQNETYHLKSGNAVGILREFDDSERSRSDPARQPARKPFGHPPEQRRLVPA